MHATDVFFTVTGLYQANLPGYRYHVTWSRDLNACVNMSKLFRCVSLVDMIQ